MLLIHRSDVIAFSVVSLNLQPEDPASDTIKIPDFPQPEARKIIIFM